ncbi:unnamed protein product [Callosobruchus maculatus]|uniref:Cyclin N-terminal domain-containing protein n=1 Tax=Callosobruchus maculatus TaxID=64391 RepID=A0A653C6R2_CALMS|nr:unnamed protein product [Callosobruchus maculatus]
MATFRIREDVENIKPYENKLKAAVVGLNDKKKKSFLDNQIKLNGLKAATSKPAAKKAKITENKENEKPKNKQKAAEPVEKLEKDLIVRLETTKENSEPRETKTTKERHPTFPLDQLHNYEYRMDILIYLKGLERTCPKPKPNYMSMQSDLTWATRAILVDWLASVSDEYKFADETFHLSVNYIDRFLSQISMIRSKFQLLGAAAMMVATKMEEYYPLDATEWSFLTGDAFTSNQVLKMEKMLLKVLRFITKPPTINEFIKRFCSAAEIDQTTEFFAMYISDLVLLEGSDYIEHFPSKLAAASIALATLHIRADKKGPWTTKLKQLSGYTLKELSPVIKRQLKTLEDSPRKQQQAIQAKYSSSRYHSVAKCYPKLNLENLENED